MFCLPWFLTWFGHSLNHYSDVVRLYDFFLASPPLMPLYLTAAIVHYRQDEVLAADCNMASIHCTLSNVSYIVISVCNCIFYVILHCSFDQVELRTWARDII